MRTDKTGLALLMLLLVTAGLFTMHTLGHFTTPHAIGTDHAALAGHIVGQEPAPAMAADPADRPAVPMGGIVACVAILCALTVLMLTALLRARSLISRLRIPTFTVAVMAAVRGPPMRPLGLAIADLAVMRT